LLFILKESKQITQDRYKIKIKPYTVHAAKSDFYFLIATIGEAFSKSTYFQQQQSVKCIAIKKRIEL
jgi:hypothetical protein